MTFHITSIAKCQYICYFLLLDIAFPWENKTLSMEARWKTQSSNVRIFMENYPEWYNDFILNIYNSDLDLENCFEGERNERKDEYGDINPIKYLQMP